MLICLIGYPYFTFRSSGLDFGSIALGRRLLAVCYVTICRYLFRYVYGHVTQATVRLLEEVSCSLFRPAYPKRRLPPVAVHTEGRSSESAANSFDASSFSLRPSQTGFCRHCTQRYIKQIPTPQTVRYIPCRTSYIQMYVQTVNKLLL